MSANTKAPSVAVRVFTAFLVARAVYGLVYLGATVGRWPLPWYFPLDHRFAIVAKPEGFAMGWFGTTALALVAAALFGGVSWLASACGVLGRALARRSVILGVARAGGMILLVDFVYFGWTLMHQTPAPLPLPAGLLPG